MSKFESKKEKDVAKSHIQLPKFILKQFVDSKENIYYYDFETNEVKRNTPKNFNVEFGYYSDGVETYLSKIERAFSKILSFANETDFEQEIIKNPGNFRCSVLEYVYALMARSNVMKNTMLKESYLLQFHSEQFQNDSAAYIGIEIGKEQKIFEDCLITFMKNKTSNPFVLPCYGIYDFGLEDGQYINMPITPKISIVFVPKEASEKYIESNKIKMIEIVDDKLIEQLNTQAFLREMQSNRRGVVAISREQLRTIAEKFKK